RERERRKRERVAEPAPQVRRERDVRERDRRAEMHRVDEQVRRREVLERMRRVPVAIPTETDAEGEDVEDDREPEESVRGVEADAVLCCLCCDRDRRHGGMNTLNARSARHRTAIEECSVT